VVWAIDVDRALLKRIKALAVLEGLHNIELVAGDLEHPMGSSLPEHTMDFVIAANILFSSHNRSALIQEIWRVLKPSGRALIIDWKDSFGGLGPHPQHVLPEADAKKLLEKEGFVQIKEVPAGEYHWGFLMRKK
jgi:ubiquinone/menaquinone biosynthesis C-methylase UbiE